MQYSSHTKQHTQGGLPALTKVREQAGFTLVELMVSLSLFIIVVLALVGSLYTTNDASRKVQAMRTVMDNLNFAVESMSRTIRTGEEIVCGGHPNNPNCPIDQTGGGGTVLSLRSTLGENKIIEYKYDPVAKNIQKRSTDLDTNGTSIATPSDWIAITSPEISVQSFHFYVSGVSDFGNDGVQPSVIIKVEGVATAGDGNTAPFAIQTYLSQRAPEK